MLAFWFGADPEPDEPDTENECEEDEHPLRVAPQPREEHRVLDRYEIAVAPVRAGSSMRPRALDARVDQLVPFETSSLVPCLAVDEGSQDSLRSAAVDDSRSRILPW